MWDKEARRRVARELIELIMRRGKPDMIVSDHGTEFTSNAILGKRSADPLCCEA
jgi:transposase InsO family protein